RLHLGTELHSAKNPNVAGTLTRLRCVQTTGDIESSARRFLVGKLIAPLSFNADSSDRTRCADIAASREVAMHIVEQSHTYWKGMAGFSKILFPTDFSNSANQAFENALCLPDFREAIIQHVVSTHFEKHPHWSTLFDIHETQKYMDMYVEAEMAKVPRQALQNIHY